METAVLTLAATRLAAVRGDIEKACRAAGRDPATVTLVAISKTFSAAAIAEVIAAGLTVFGENRVQEAKAKWPPLKAEHPGLELHLVGPLQSNKVKDALALFDAITSVDRPSLGAAVAKEVIAAVQTVFGENRVQEAKAKWPPLKAEHPGLEGRPFGLGL